MVDIFILLMFVVGLAGTLYAYVGFPLLLMLFARVFKRQGPIARAAAPESVTVIIPAFNEEAHLGAKIRNTLASDYPASLLDVIVVSDASTDRTDDIARSFADAGVRLIVQEQRRGKTAGLNRAVAAARGTILIFTDANATFAPDTIARLVAHLADPAVGLVSGYTRYRVAGNGEVAEVTNAYTALERLIKRAESRWGRCVGADGAIFAMRRHLYRTLRDDDINDFVLPLGVIDQGSRCVLAEDAYCSENPGQDFESEFRRQARITNRTLRALARHAHLLNPFRFPAFAFLLLSHKVARFLVPAFATVAILGLLAVAARVPGYGPLLTAAATVLLGAISWRLLATRESQRGRMLQLMQAFVTVNIAIAVGWWKFLSGQGDITWQHDRTPVA